MAKIDRLYIATALFLLVIGMLLGLYMGVAGDGTVRDTHVAILLPGFVTLAVYGVIYRLWPAMKMSALARVQFWSAAIGAALQGLPFFIGHRGLQDLLDTCPPKHARHGEGDAVLPVVGSNGNHSSLVAQYDLRDARRDHADSELTGLIAFDDGDVGVPDLLLDGATDFDFLPAAIDLP